MKTDMAIPVNLHEGPRGIIALDKVKSHNTGRVDGAVDMGKQGRCSYCSQQRKKKKECVY